MDNKNVNRFCRTNDETKMNKRRTRVKKAGFL